MVKVLICSVTAKANTEILQGIRYHDNPEVLQGFTKLTVLGNLHNKLS